MIRIKWPVALATLFVLLLGWYLLYTQQIVEQVRGNSALLSRIFAEVQEGLVTQGNETQVLFNLQGIVRDAGVPLVVMGPADTVLFHENLPFSVDVNTG